MTKCVHCDATVLTAASDRAQQTLIPAGKQAKFKGEAGGWFGVYDWHDQPETFEYRTVYALTSTERGVPPGHELCSSCGRLFKFGETCTRGGCSCGGDV